jgi:hypothetical protein
MKRTSSGSLISKMAEETAEAKEEPQPMLMEFPTDLTRKGMQFYSTVFSLGKKCFIRVAHVISKSHFTTRTTRPFLPTCA